MSVLWCGELSGMCAPLGGAAPTAARAPRASSSGRRGPKSARRAERAGDASFLPLRQLRIQRLILCVPLLRSDMLSFADEKRQQKKKIQKRWKKNCNKKYGDAGYRSPYLSHAKRALYHLSYTPNSMEADHFLLYT